MLFNQHLRRLVKARDDASRPDPPSFLRQALVAALRIGRDRAVVGAVAAGAAGALVAGPHGAAAGALGAIFVDEATKELFKTWIQAAFVADESAHRSSGWIDEPADAMALITGGLALAEHRKVETDLMHGTLLARRGIFALLELMEDGHHPGHDAAWETARHLLDTLAHMPPDLGMARKIADLLDGLTRSP